MISTGRLSRRDLTLQSIAVRVTGDFGKEGEPASNIKYEVDIKSPHAQDVITKLIKDVDNVAEVHNTLRKGVAVELVG
jgi:hypothetical protein